jgi:hypothetical protein
LSAPAVAYRAAPPIRQAVFAVVALIVAIAAILSSSGTAAAAGYAPRVVIVVGPSGGSTSLYLERANRYAEQARAYGATVAELYTPHATWARVLAASQGANVLIYLGHGNGWPSPYAPYQGLTKDGLGLNPTDGSGRASPVKYYGEDIIASHLRLAPGAIVLFNHLCYASGSGEPGSSNPSWDTARRRVDNYAAGFIRAGAAAVIADAHTSLGGELHTLFRTRQSVLAAWRADPDRHGHERSFASARTPGFGVHLDPDNPKSGFYRSIVTKGSVRTTNVRIAALHGATTTDVIVRDAASTKADSVTRIGEGAKLWVTGRLRTDGSGRTWAPVVTAKGVKGFVAAWLGRWSGSAVTTTSVVVRSSASTSARKVATVKEHQRVTVIRSVKDRHERVWLQVRTARGTTGWMAAWLMRR